MAIIISIGAIVLAYEVLLSDQAVFVERRGFLRQWFSKARPDVAVLHGWPVFWIFLVLVLVALMALTFVLDHYDHRFNERFYVKLRHSMLAITSGVILAGVISAYLQIWTV